MRETAASSLMITGVTGQFGRVFRYGLIYKPLPGKVTLHGRRQMRLDGIELEALDLQAGFGAWQDMISHIAPDTILHLAGVTYTSGLDLEAMVALNVDAACTVAKAADAAGVQRFFYASTAGVYGVQDDDAAPWREDAALRPVNDYARSKAMGEEALQTLAAQFEMSITCLRYATTGGSDLLVRNALLATPEAPLTLDRFADGSSPERSYLGPQELAEIHRALLGRRVKPLPSVVNIAPRGAVQMHQLLDVLPDVFGRPVDWTTRPAGPNAIKRSVLACDVLETVLGHSLAHTTPQGLAHQIKAFIDAGIAVA